MTGSRGETGWERLFWLVFERTSNPVVLLDEDRRIVDINDPAVQLLGGDRDELIGSSIRDSVKPSERPRSDREWKEFLISGEYSGCALGRETGEIAGELHISPETVRSHVRNAMSKLDVHTRAQLVAVVLCAEHVLMGSLCDPAAPPS
jgi:PAS domain S-box-containing protein